MTGVSWREVLDEDSARLPQHEARWIVEEASGHEGGALVAHLDDAVTQRALVRHDEMVARRLAGEPLQYVLGRWAFRTLDLAVDRRALIPRPETEQLVDVALVELDRLGGRDRPTRVLDLGTGSGAIALSICVERPRTSVWAVERSGDALALARANTAGLGRPATRVTLVQGSWFEPLDPALAGSFELVVSNPPYVATVDELDGQVRDWEPAEALFAGGDGLDDVRHIISEAPHWLAPGGALVVEIGEQHAGPVRSLALAAGYAEAEVVDDLSGRPRVLRARR